MTQEKVLLVALQLKSEKPSEFEVLLGETKELIKAAEVELVDTIIQKRDSIERATLVGPGKLQEIKELVDELNIDTVIFNLELSGSQFKNIYEVLEVKVIDRTMLILDIFAHRAHSAQGKLQVKLAQLQYRLPRLKETTAGLSRQAGGIGTRGPGESKLELNRRYILAEITQLKKQLKQVKKQQLTQSKRRRQSDILKVALVGYTNVGKSTIFNALVNEGQKVLAKDQLFASLQTYTRKVSVNTQSFLLSDTVGFVSNLPHHLVESFHSTLEEVKEADVIIHVVDRSSEQWLSQMDVVNDTLKTLDLEDKVILTYYNKMDKSSEKVESPLAGSALIRKDMKKLLDVILSYS